MIPRPESVWTIALCMGVVCVAAAGFMVGPKCGLWCLGMALLWMVKIAVGSQS